MTIARALRSASSLHRPRGVALIAGLILAAAAGGTKPAPALAADLVIGPAADGLTIDGEVGEWLGKPPSLLLQPASAHVRSGRIWLAESEDGLIVAGQVASPGPRFPPSAAEMDGGDHVALAVTLIEDLPLPKIGWTEASGPVELAAAEDCARLETLADDENAVADCKAWFGEKAVYRRRFLELLVRRWRLAPGLVEENFASRAFGALPAAARDALNPLAPQVAPVARFKTPTDSGYSFEMLVPWAALPPSPVPELSRLRLSVEAVSPPAGGPRSAATTAEHQPPVEAPAMMPARLEPPRRWRLSPCSYPLAGFDGSAPGPLPGLFLPTAGADVATIFVIENPTADERTATGGFSPGITRTTFFSRVLAPDVAICGPPLAVSRGKTVVSQAEVTISPGLKVSPVKGGWLVADGPYTVASGRLANDECGGCPLISLRLFYVAAAGGAPVTAFDDAWLIEDPDVTTGSGGNARVSLRSNLTAIDAYEAEVIDARGRREWSHLRHCYDADAHVFKECGRWPNAAPPVALAMPPEPPPP